MSGRLQPHHVREVFEGRIFTVLVESITLPNGHPLDAEIVILPEGARSLAARATGLRIPTTKVESLNAAVAAL